MPVIETDFSGVSSRQKHLFDQLVEELKSPKSSGQPRIEIRQMKRDGLKHVHVIWDEWDECPPEERAEIIREAFVATKGSPYEKSIAITMAATTPEAVEAGLLPYEVKPFRWHLMKEPERSAVREALLREGASPLGRSWLPILAFASPEQGEEAVHRLKLSAPNFEWGVVDDTNAKPHCFAGNPV